MSVSYIKVLLIEDNPVHTRLIEKLLAKASRNDFDVTSADRLSVGLEDAEDLIADLVQALD